MGEGEGRGKGIAVGPGALRWRLGTLGLTLGVLVLLPGIFITVAAYLAHETDTPAEKYKIVGPVLVTLGTVLLALGTWCKCTANVTNVEPEDIVRMAIIEHRNRRAAAALGATDIATILNISRQDNHVGRPWASPRGAEEPDLAGVQEAEPRQEPPPAHGDNQLQSAMQSDPYLASLVRKQQAAHKQFEKKPEVAEAEATQEAFDDRDDEDNVGQGRDDEDNIGQSVMTPVEDIEHSDTEPAGEVADGAGEEDGNRRDGSDGVDEQENGKGGEAPGDGTNGADQANEKSETGQGNGNSETENGAHSNGGCKNDEESGEKGTEEEGT